VRVLRKVTRIMIEGFMEEFQIFHCGILVGKKIWKVAFWGWGGERGAMPCDSSMLVGRRGSKQSENWCCLAPLAYTTSVVLPDKVQPSLFCGCFIYMQIFQLSVTFIVSFLLISNNFVVTFINGYTSEDVCGSIQNVSEIKRQVKSYIFFS